jgi:hypothetical protein
VVSIPFLVELIQWLIFHSSQINNSVFPGHFQIDISFEAGLILAVLPSIKQQIIGLFVDGFLRKLLRISNSVFNRPNCF